MFLLLTFQQINAVCSKWKKTLRIAFFVLSNILHYSFTRLFFYFFYFLCSPTLRNLSDLLIVKTVAIFYQSCYNCCKKNSGSNFLRIVWVKVFNNCPSEICWRQPFKNLKWYGLPKQTIIITSIFLKAVFHKFYLVHSWIPWSIFFSKKYTVDYYSEPTSSNSFKNNSTENTCTWLESILIFYSRFLKKYGCIDLINTLKMLQNQSFFSFEYLKNKRFDQTK